MASFIPDEPMPEAVNPPVEPTPPTTMQPQDGQSVAAVIMQRLDKLDHDIEILGRAQVRVLEQTGANQPQPEQPQQGGGGLLNTILSNLGGLERLAGGGGDPMNDLYVSVGKKLVDKTLETTLNRVVGQLGGEVKHTVIDR